MMSQPQNNKLIIAAAGSGKTTYLVEQALANEHKSVLITTYTQANTNEIRERIISKIGYVPENIKIDTWFSFILKHCVKPYQGGMTATKVKGILFVPGLSMIGVGESDTDRYYLSDHKVYSDKLTKFAVKSDEASEGAVVDRVCNIFDIIYIDEIQDMSGYDLDLITMLLRARVEIVMVGDPRQATYTTHADRKNKPYERGGTEQFIKDKCPNLCSIDYSTLGASHRNSVEICAFSTQIFPEYPPVVACSCSACKTPEGQMQGVFLIPEASVGEYQKQTRPIILKWNKAKFPEWNFGMCKGKTFDNVLMYPTKGFEGYLIDGELSTIKKIKGIPTEQNRFDRTKLYVACSRSRYSLGIVCNTATLDKIDSQRLADLHASIYT